MRACEACASNRSSSCSSWPPSRSARARLLGRHRPARHRLRRPRSHDARPEMVWHNDPPKLATVGFAHAPLITVALLPFTVVPSMASSLIALVLCSAIFGGLFVAGVHPRAAPRWHRPQCATCSSCCSSSTRSSPSARRPGGRHRRRGVGHRSRSPRSSAGTPRSMSLPRQGGLAFGAAVVADYAFIAWLLLAALVNRRVARACHARRTRRSRARSSCSSRPPASCWRCGPSSTAS